MSSNSFNSKNSVQYTKTVPLQTIQFSISTQFKCQTFLFQAFQFCISTQFSSVWPIDRTLSVATAPGQSQPKIESNEGALRIPQSFSITGTSQSDCLVSYLGHSLGSVFLLWRESVGVFYSPNRLSSQFSKSEGCGILLHWYYSQVHHNQLW